MTGILATEHITDERLWFSTLVQVWRTSISFFFFQISATSVHSLDACCKKNQEILTAVLAQVRANAQSLASNAVQIASIKKILKYDVRNLTQWLLLSRCFKIISKWWVILKLQASLGEKDSFSKPILINYICLNYTGEATNLKWLPKKVWLPSLSWISYAVDESINTNLFHKNVHADDNSGHFLSNAFFLLCPWQMQTIDELHLISFVGKKIRGFLLKKIHHDLSNKEKGNLATAWQQSVIVLVLFK